MMGLECQTDLADIIGALDASGGLASGLDGREQQGCQDSHDGQDHQQFDQRQSVRWSGSQHDVPRP
jgi:hypothetical protein